MRINDRILFNLFVALVPLGWVSGLSFVLFHLFSSYVYFFRTRQKIGVFTLSIFALCLACFISIVIAIFRGEGSESRYVAAAYNLLTLAAGAFLYTWVKQYATSFDDNRSSPATILLCINIAFALISAAIKLGSDENLFFYTLIGVFLPAQHGLVGEYQLLKLGLVDWYDGGPAMRTYVFAPFATISAGVAISMYSLWLYFRNPGVFAAVVSAVAMYSLVFYTTLTRSSAASLVVFLAVVITMSTARVLRIFALLLGSVILLALYTQLGADLSDARAGSTAARLNVYAYSWEFVVEQSPLFGLGFRPHSDDFIIPIGSHSTFLSIFTRSGILGLALFAASTVIVPAIFIGYCIFTVDAIPRRYRYLSGSLMAILTWMVFQDLDAYAVVAFPTFALYALFYKQSPKVFIGRGSMIKPSGIPVSHDRNAFSRNLTRNVED